MNQSKVKPRTLDLTDPKQAAKYGYDPNSKDYDSTRKVADQAKAAGYSVLKYNSVEGDGVNYAFLNNNTSDELAEMLMPIDWTELP